MQQLADLHKEGPFLEEELDGANIDEDDLQRGEEEEAGSILHARLEGLIEAKVDDAHGDGKEEVHQGLHNGGLGVPQQAHKGAPTHDAHLPREWRRVANVLLLLGLLAPLLLRCGCIRHRQHLVEHAEKRGWWWCDYALYRSLYGTLLNHALTVHYGVL